MTRATKNALRVQRTQRTRKPVVPPQFAAAAASWGTIMPAALYRAHPALPTTSEGFGALLRTVIGMPLPICLAPTGSSLHRNAAASYWESIIALQCYLVSVTLALLIADVKKEIAQYFTDIESIFKRVSINRGKGSLQPATTGYPSGAGRRGSGDCRKSLWVFPTKGLQSPGGKLCGTF